MPRAWEQMAAVIDAQTLPKPLRVAILAAHPDDEIVSAGALLRRLCATTAEVHVVHVTDGAPRNPAVAHEHGYRSIDAYRRVRQRELRHALDEAGITPRSTRQLRVPDQQAAHRLVDVTRAIDAFIESCPMDVVLSHPFEGGHPDHDACAFAVHAAVATRPRDAQPLIVEFTSYHHGPNGISTGVFRADGHVSVEAMLTLGPDEEAIKRRARECFVSQAPMLSQFLLTHERYRIAPVYAFTGRAHVGRLFYEYFDWNLDGAGWQSAAADALRTIGFRTDEWL